MIPSYCKNLVVYFSFIYLSIENSCSSAKLLLVGIVTIQIRTLHLLNQNWHPYISWIYLEDLWKTYRVIGLSTKSIRFVLPPILGLYIAQCLSPVPFFLTLVTHLSNICVQSSTKNGAAFLIPESQIIEHMCGSTHILELLMYMLKLKPTLILLYKD